VQCHVLTRVRVGVRVGRESWVISGFSHGGDTSATALQAGYKSIPELMYPRGLMLKFSMYQIRNRC
jgi:hypothetical protein